MKLNKKGYMLVEIIVSFAIAMTIAYYLFSLTIKLKNKNEDIYYSTLYESNKIAITKNIMNDLNRGTIIDTFSNGQADLTSNGEKTISFKIKLNEEPQKEEWRSIRITKDGTKTTIEYGKTNTRGGAFETTDISYYKKTLEKSLSAKKIIYKLENNNEITIEIEIETMYSDNKYNIKLISSYSPT